MPGPPSTTAGNVAAGERSTEARRQRLIVFSRYPEPGKTKTRLIPALGPAGAADLHRQMARRTFRWAKELAAAGSALVEVHFSGGSENQMRQCFGDDLPYQAQVAGDLGDRLAAAFQRAFRAGTQRALVVGTDCPGLSRAVAEDALARLSDSDLVLGPAADGGYYLIGLRREVPQLFSDIPWGTGEVLETTLRKARELKMSVSLLQMLRDVDQPEDLDVWHCAAGSEGHCAAGSEGHRAAGSEGHRAAGSEGHCAAGSEGHCVNTESQSSGDTGRISVVVPTLNEEAGLLGATLRSAGQGHDVETIVVDVHRRDSIRQVAAACGARALSAPYRPGPANERGRGSSHRPDPPFPPRRHAVAGTV